MVVMIIPIAVAVAIVAAILNPKLWKVVFLVIGVILLFSVGSLTLITGALTASPLLIVTIIAVILFIVWGKKK